MNLDTQENYLRIIQDKFQQMQKMLKQIQGNIIQYPVFTQIEFIKPIETMILEALFDSRDDNNEFLNNYDGGDDKIKV